MTEAGSSMVAHISIFFLVDAGFKGKILTLSHFVEHRGFTILIC